MTLTLVSLALTASPASAGSYSDPNFSGGYWTFDDDPNSYPFPQANPYAGGHEAANFCGGDLTATSTWTPDNSTDTSPAPQVIVTQVADAYWDVRGVNGYPTASCADGLGDSEVDTTYMAGYYGGDSGRTNYSVQPPSGNTVTVTCSGVSATMDLNSTTPPVDDGDVGASWGVTLSPVTIIPYGATSDGNGGWGILVGQHCSPELEGIPDALEADTTYVWTVSGTKFQSWEVSPDSSTTTEADGPGALNIESPGWYWNDPQAEDETITCTATVTPPAGEGSRFTVTASELVSVYVPNWTGIGTGGYVKVGVSPDANQSNGYSGFEIFAGATDPMISANQLGGMNFVATVQSPAPALFGDGSLKLVQLVTPRESWVVQDGLDQEPGFGPDYGEEGLDGAYPYGWASTAIVSGVLTYKTNDTPGFDLLDTYMISANLKQDFEDFLMYLAPGSSQPVPVAHFVWGDNGSAQIPSTGFWKDYAAEHGGSDNVGTVTPSGSDSDFLPDNVFPNWTQIN